MVRCWPTVEPLQDLYSGVDFHEVAESVDWHVETDLELEMLSEKWEICAVA